MPLDIGAGILLALLVAHGFGVEPIAGFIAFGIVCALLPDIDNVIPLLRRTEYDHRSFFHYPILYVPIALLIYILLGSSYFTLYALCIAAHFIHDTIGIGWGVAWLWPLSRRKFLIPEKGRRKDRGLFISWMPEEEPALAARYHNPNWLRDYYLRPTAISIIEYGFLLFAIVILMLSI
jgi:hypothetical protein